MTSSPTGRAGRRHRAILSLLACVAAAALAGMSEPGRQAPAQPPQQPPTFRTEANLVRVDAYPMLDGTPIVDLTRDDFQVFEDGVPQRVESFEHIIVRAAGAQSERIEPNSQGAGYQMAADPHNRVFVLFLDTYHVSVEGSHRIRRPLVDLLDRLLGPDDLIGVMTPEMPASQLMLARKTEVIEGALTQNWVWGRLDVESRPDPVELAYRDCYPSRGTSLRSSTADEMIKRRREKLTLDAMHALVERLAAIREERKFIITVSDGWTLFPASSNPADTTPAYPPDVYLRPPNNLPSGERPLYVARLADCDRDRVNLASQDDQRYFRDILDEAARSNASFYPVDPRGMPAVDTPIGPDAPLPPAADRAQLQQRAESLRTLAVATDGVAVLGSNDIESGLKKVVADLNSYYLLGYYSTNTKLDGKWRKIQVKVARPGVEVRARRGYRAPSAAELSAGTPAPAMKAPEEGAAVARALDHLSALRHDTELSVSAVPLSDGRATKLRIVGELGSAFARRDPWRQGGEAAVIVTGAGGASLAATRVPLMPGAWTFAAEVPLAGSGAAGECSVQVRLTPTARGGAPVGAAVKVALPGQTAPTIGPALLFRRGPTTGNVYLPAADPRFLRAERVKLEAPLAADAGGLAGRLLDRAGHPLEVPVAVAERTDGGQRWLVAEVSLAPLTSGDYLVELSAAAAGRTEKTLTGLRLER